MPAKQRLCAECGRELLPAAGGKVCPDCLSKLGGDLLDSELPLSSVSVNEEPFLQPAARHFGDYELLEEIAHGGMGVVYKARQKSLNRLVALKMIRVGQFASASDIKRFHTEAEAAAHLDHPNLVPIYEVGETDGQPFFTMKLVEGGSLADRIADCGLRISDLGENRTSTLAESRIQNPKSKANKAAIRERQTRLATLLAKVARAVHHAHQHGILHRDLKPANILIDPQGEPHVTDFGLAKLMETESDLTLSGAVLGTPNYIAPEQAAGKTRQLTTRSDVYSLGAILYHLLTGQPPFRASTPMETLRQVVERDPARPSTINLRADRDLQTICLKCLEKEPQRRYHSAEALAEDLERWLRQEPIRARPATAWEQTWKWMKRRPALAAMLAGIVVTFLLGFMGVLWQWRRAEGAYGQAADALSRMQLRQAEELFEAEKTAEAMALLSRMLRDDPKNSIAAERLMSAIIYRSFCLPLGKPLKHEDEVYYSEFSRDGKRVVTASADQTVRVWDAETGEPRSKPMPHKDCVVTAHFASTGDRLVTASMDGTLRIWNTATGDLAAEPLHHEGPVWSAVFNADDSRIISASADGSAQIWDAKTGARAGNPLRHGGEVFSAQFSPDGKRALTASADQTVQVWNAETGKPVFDPLQHDAAVKSARFSSDGRRIVTVSGNVVRIWDAASGKLIHTIEHSNEVLFAHCSPDGPRLVTGAADGTARVWDMESGEAMTDRLLHPSKVLYAAFAPLSHLIVTIAADSTVRLWEARTGRLVRHLIRHGAWVWAAQFSPDRQRLVTSSKSGQIWDVQLRSALPLPLDEPFPVTWAQFNDESDWRGRMVVAAGTQVRIWSAASSLRVSDPATEDQPVRMVEFRPGHMSEFSSNGLQILTVSGNTARLWKWKQDKTLAALSELTHPRLIYCARFSPDGNRVITASEDHTARIWKLSDDSTPGAKALTEATVRHEKAVLWADFSPDGLSFVTASTDQTARAWDSVSGNPLTAPLVHGAPVESVQFSPDGRMLLTVSENGAHLWNVQKGRPTGRPMRHAARITSARFSPDGRWVGTASADNTARVWSAQNGQPISEPIRHLEDVVWVEFGPVGERVLTASKDGTARVWDVRTGQPRSEVIRLAGPVSLARFSRDGQRFMAATGGAARIYDVLSSGASSWKELPRLAESIAGLRLDDRRVAVPVPVEDQIAFQEKVRSHTNATAQPSWVNWVFASRAARSISPLSIRETPEFLRDRAEWTQTGLPDLQAAIQLAPTNQLALARSARNLLAQNPRQNPRQLAEASWHLDQAWKLDPSGTRTPWQALLEMWWTRAEILERKGDLTGALDAAKIGRTLEFPSYCNFYARLLEKANRSNDIHLAHARALDLSVKTAEHAIYDFMNYSTRQSFNLRRAVVANMDRFGIGHSRTVASGLRLVEYFEESGKPEEAAALAHALYDLATRDSRSDRAVFVELVRKLSELYHGLNLPDQAGRFHRLLEQIKQNHPNAGHITAENKARESADAAPPPGSRIMLRLFNADGSEASNEVALTESADSFNTGVRMAIDTARNEVMVAWTRQPLPVPVESDDTVRAARLNLDTLERVTGERGREILVAPRSTVAAPSGYAPLHRQLISDLKFNASSGEIYVLIDVWNSHRLDTIAAGTGLVRLDSDNKRIGDPADSRWDPETETILINDGVDLSEEKGALAIFEKTGDYLISWMRHSPRFSGRCMPWAKAYGPDHRAKRSDFQLMESATDRSYPRLQMDQATGHVILAYNYNYNFLSLNYDRQFPDRWEIRGQVMDVAMYENRVDSDLVVERLLPNGGDLPGPGGRTEFLLTQMEVEGDLGPIEEIGRPFNLSYHQATGRLVLSYVQKMPMQPARLFGKTFVFNFAASPPTLKEIQSGGVQGARLLASELASTRHISQDLHEKTGRVVITWTERDADGSVVYAATFDPETWEVVAPKHRVGVQREGDESSPFVCIDQRNGNYLVAWTRDVLPLPETAIVAAADGNGDPIRPGGTMVSTSVHFQFASTAPGNETRFRVSLDGNPPVAGTSSNAFSGLAPGPHTLSVSAVDGRGHTNPTPALFTWEVLTPQGGVNALANRVQELVGDGVLSVEQAGSLNEKLRAAVLHFEGQRMDSGARELSAFSNQVRVYARAGILMASEEANLLREGGKIEKALRQIRQKQTAKWEEGADF